ncbi:hypothetical protein ABNN70_01665 [Sporolactobacillus sp. Y61]|uniref:Uncharacterized protein n=1 Tax=Sporolactobacillus sp. Y61 TaxID=3160863 RepID=A0AAU8IH40_9BACL
MGASWPFIAMLDKSIARKYVKASKANLTGKYLIAIKILSDYEIPYYWDFTQFFTLFLTADYIFHDFRQNQLYVLLRCRSKRRYILSKIMWIIFQNLIFHIYAITAVVLSFVFTVLILMVSWVAGGLMVGFDNTWLNAKGMVWYYTFR